MKICVGIKMKSLYESILSSTKSGKDFEAQKVIDWFKSTQEYKGSWGNSSEYGAKQTEVKASYINGGWEINMIGDNIHFKTVEAFNFEREDTKDGILPFKIVAVKKNGKIMNVNYKSLKFKSSDEFVDDVPFFMSFWGCEIDKIDKLPKNCETVQFFYRHMIGGGRAVSVKEIKNIKVKEFCQDETSRRGGLVCRLSNIKNITVTEKMDISDEMLGYFSLDKGGRKFKQDASDMLTEFFKNNKVDPEICRFIATENNSCTKFKAGSIWYDKKENIWKFKGDKLK